MLKISYTPFQEIEALFDFVTVTENTSKEHLIHVLLDLYEANTELILYLGNVPPPYSSRDDMEEYKSYVANSVENLHDICITALLNLLAEVKKDNHLDLIYEEAKHYCEENKILAVWKGYKTSSLENVCSHYLYNNRQYPNFSQSSYPSNFCTDKPWIKGFQAVGEVQLSYSNFLLLDTISRYLNVDNEVKGQSIGQVVINFMRYLTYNKVSLVSIINIINKK